MRSLILTFFKCMLNKIFRYIAVSSLNFMLHFLKMEFKKNAMLKRGFLGGQMALVNVFPSR